MRKLLPTLVLGSGVIIGFVACSSDASGPPPPSGVCSGSTFSLAPLEGRVMTAADVPCLTIAADGGTYVVVPQFPSASAANNPVAFTIAAGNASTSMRVVTATKRALPTQLSAAQSGPESGALQRQFEHMQRSRERALGAEAKASNMARGPLANRVLATVAPPAIGSTRTFQVRKSLDSNPSYATDTAVLKYAGNHLLIYVSKNAPAPPTNGFSDAQISAFGNTFDLDLYAIDVATFGQPTDIDGNGRVLVLITPLVNKLTASNTCQTQGYIAGFFDAPDLVPSESHSNDAELFYALAPDPQGTFSCVHNVSSVGEITPSTFIHEFQHMISFGQHFIIRDGDEEDAWLNEGLSHIAEELGSRYYENRFPPPTGRTDPAQLFPDSAQGFITGDVYNSYHYLLDPSSTDANDAPSVSDWAADGSLVERGAVWLFLRWLGDQQDSTIYGRLDQTSKTGVPNVEAASGASFTTLFGEFALALYTDSLPGVPRSSVPSQFRFKSRNLRAIYARENLVNNANYPVAFPIELKALDPGSQVNASMYPGTVDFYVLTAPSSGNPVVMTFKPSSGTFDASLNAQMSVFHCPSASACQ
jgi:hypothetical protein